MSTRPSMKHGAVALALAALHVVAAAQELARPEVGRPLIAAQELLKTGQPAAALAKLREAEAVGALSPYEAYLVHRTRSAAAVAAGDVTLAANALDAAFASGRMSPDEQRELAAGLAHTAWHAKDAALAARWAQRYFAIGGNDERLRTLLVQAQMQTGDCAGVVRELQTMIGADTAAGRAPAEARLRLLASCQHKLGDEAGHQRSIEALALHHPKPDVWRALLARVQVPERLQLDLYRLHRATATLDADDALPMAQLALRNGFPGEAKAVLADAMQREPSVGDALRRLHDQAAQQASADDKLLADTAAPKDAETALRTGLALATAGRVTQGLVLIEHGVARGGLKRPDEARLHLGIVQWMAGRFADAQATLHTVRGDDAAPLARLWALLAQSSAQRRAP